MERKKSPMEKKVKSKILIIGGTGFIGYHLAKKCLTLGWKVTSFSIKKPKSLRKLKKVKYLTGNLNSKFTQENEPFTCKSTFRKHLIKT